MSGRKEKSPSESESQATIFEEKKLGFWKRKIVKQPLFTQDQNPSNHLGVSQQYTKDQMLIGSDFTPPLTDKELISRSLKKMGVTAYDHSPKGIKKRQITADEEEHKRLLRFEAEEANRKPEDNYGR